MPNCAVYGCHNHTRKTKGSEVRYLRFPKNEELCKKWVIACKRKDKINVDNGKMTYFNLYTVIVPDPNVIKF